MVDGEVIRPKVLIVPTGTGTPATGETGTLMFSGGKLWVRVSTTAWQIVTSA